MKITPEKTEKSKNYPSRSLHQQLLKGAVITALSAGFVFTPLTTMAKQTAKKRPYKTRHLLGKPKQVISFEKRAEIKFHRDPQEPLNQQNPHAKLWIQNRSNYPITVDRNRLIFTLKIDQKKYQIRPLPVKDKGGKVVIQPKAGGWFFLMLTHNRWSGLPDIEGKGSIYGELKIPIEKFKGKLIAEQVIQIKPVPILLKKRIKQIHHKKGIRIKLPDEKDF